MNSIDCEEVPGQSPTSSNVSMGIYESSLLRACREVIRRTQEMAPLWAQTLGVQPHEVFHQWVIGRKVFSGEK